MGCSVSIVKFISPNFPHPGRHELMNVSQICESLPQYDCFPGYSSRCHLLLIEENSLEYIIISGEMGFLFNHIQRKQKFN